MFCITIYITYYCVVVVAVCLYLFIFFSLIAGHIEAAKLLLTKGAPINQLDLQVIITTHLSSLLLSPLHSLYFLPPFLSHSYFPLAFPSPNFLYFLFSFRPYFYSQQFETVLHLAVSLRNVEFVRLLVEWKGKLPDGQTDNKINVNQLSKSSVSGILPLSLLLY